MEIKIFKIFGIIGFEHIYRAKSASEYFQFNQEFFPICRFFAFKRSAVALVQSPWAQAFGLD